MATAALCQKCILRDPNRALTIQDRTFPLTLLRLFLPLGSDLGRTYAEATEQREGTNQTRAGTTIRGKARPRIGAEQARPSNEGSSDYLSKTGTSDNREDTAKSMS